jgi:hypothetical protein
MNKIQFTNIELHKILTLIEVGRLKWSFLSNFERGRRSKIILSWIDKKKNCLPKKLYTFRHFTSPACFYCSTLLVCSWSLSSMNMCGTLTSSPPLVVVCKFWLMIPINFSMLDSTSDHNRLCKRQQEMNTSSKKMTPNSNFLNHFLKILFKIPKKIPQHFDLSCVFCYTIILGLYG